MAQGKSKSKIKAVRPSRGARSEAFAKIIEALEYESKPERMSRADYKELLGELIADLEDRLGIARAEDTDR